MTETHHYRDEWESRYRSGETGWDRGNVSPALDHWLDEGGLAPCRILVPGCGRGYEVVALAGRGFEVTAIDIAPTAVRELTALLDRAGVEAEVVEENLLEWQPDRTFDAVYEQTCLCALQPTTWSRYAQRLRGWLRPGGQLFTLFMQTGEDGGPPFHCDLEVMHRLFPEGEWAWQDDAALRVSHPSGRHELGYRLTRTL